MISGGQDRIKLRMVPLETAPVQQGPQNVAVGDIDGDGIDEHVSSYRVMPLHIPRLSENSKEKVERPLYEQAWRFQQGNGETSNRLSIQRAHYRGGTVFVGLQVHIVDNLEKLKAFEQLERNLQAIKVVSPGIYRVTKIYVKVVDPTRDSGKPVLKYDVVLEFVKPATFVYKTSSGKVWKQRVRIDKIVTGFRSTTSEAFLEFRNSGQRI